MGWSKKRRHWRSAVRNFLYRYIGVRARRRAARALCGVDLPLEDYLRSHVCLEPFQRLEITDRGLAHFCCPDWLPTPIGRLDSNLKKQWRGATAEKIRQSVIDGSYSYCSRTHCPQIANRTLPARDSAEVQATLAKGAPDGPAYIALSHDRSCNLTCPSCRTKAIVAGKAEQERLDALFDKSVKPLLQAAESVYVTGSGDPFASNHFRRIIANITRDPQLDHLFIDLHTNGQLWDARAWSDLGLAGRVHYAHVSIDAATAETYAILRRGGSFEKLRRNLAFIGDLRRAGEIIELELSMVVQARNFREMPDFVRLGEEFGADYISFQMIRNWGTFGEPEFRAEFIGDPAHPQHAEFRAILAAPELRHAGVEAANVFAYAGKPAAAAPWLADARSRGRALRKRSAAASLIKA